MSASLSSEGEPVDYEVVKCVLVGDSGVGKTKLVSARASGVNYTLGQLVSSHVPTVWAIDKYSTDKEVLEMSRFQVDDTYVSMRLWDTFGYHDKDRRFAYARAHVVLLCFSVVQPLSLKNLADVWYPEVKRCCPGTPIVVVGCKTDLRYLYLDEEFQRMEKNPFFRPVFESDLITPEKGREVARSIGAYYYECNVLTRDGLSAVFENAVRAALLKRINTRFWTSGLKRISKPQVQPPDRPPRPAAPPVTAAPGVVTTPPGLSLVELQSRGEYCDLEIVPALSHSECDCKDGGQRGAEGKEYEHYISYCKCTTRHEALLCHRVIVAAACPSLRSLLKMADSHSSLPTQMEDERIGAICSMDATADDCLPLLNQSKQAGDGCEASLTDGSQSFVLNHPLFRRLSVRKTRTEASHCPSARYRLEADEAYGFEVLQTWVHFLYTGKLSPSFSVRNVDSLEQLKALADCLQFAELRQAVQARERLTDTQETASLSALSSPFSASISPPGIAGAAGAELSTDSSVRSFEELLALETFLERRDQAIAEEFSDSADFTDVCFSLDDGEVKAHKVLLATKSEVLHALFSNNFMESFQSVIDFPCATEECFKCVRRALLRADLPVSLHPYVCLELIELANQLCLPEVVTLAEVACVTTLAEYEEQKRDTVAFTLALLEQAQLHNADQLFRYCLHHLSVNYLHMFRRHYKDMVALSSTNRNHLIKHRWPPLWYLKEADYYQKCYCTTQTDQDPTGASDIGSPPSFPSPPRRSIYTQPLSNQLHTAKRAVAGAQLYEEMVHEGIIPQITSHKTQLARRNSDDLYSGCLCFSNRKYKKSTIANEI